MRTSSYADFKENIGNYIKTVNDDCDEVVINRDGMDTAVLLSYAEYSSLMETLHLLSSPGTMADIRQADRDLQEGKGIEVNIDEL